MSCQRIYCIKSIFFCKYFRKNSEFYTFSDAISVIRKEGYPISRKGENIYKRKDGRWEARYIKGYELSGKAKYGFCYGKSYKEAKEKVSKCKAEIVVGRPVPPTDHRHRFSFFCDEWLRLRKSKVRESTYIFT